jgi:hypothetical protein
MVDRTYSFAGISKINGKFKARFSDRATYVKNLAMAGNTDIDLIELMEPMTKIDAVKYMLAIKFDKGDSDIRAALEQNLDIRLDRVRAKSAPIDDPVVYLREICTRLAELNELVARMTAFNDEADTDSVEQDSELDNQPF